MSLKFRLATIAVAVVVLSLLLQRACTPDPSPVLEDTRWRDSLHVRQVEWEQDSAMRAAQIEETTARADSLRRVAVAGEGRYRRLARWADSVAKAGAGTFHKDSANESLSPDHNSPNLDTYGVGPVYERPDSEQVVPRVAYDSLYSAYETADSMNAVLHGAVREYVQAASLYASQAVAATGRYDWAVHTYQSRIDVLTAALRKQTKGCRVVGLIPCPTIAVGYGAMLTGGQVRLGPTVTVSIPVRF